MYRQPYHEVTVVFVEIEFGRRRTVLPHRTDDFRDARRAAFGEFQFLQDLANAPVSVAAGLGTPGTQLLQPHRAIRTGVAQHHQFIVRDTNLHGLPNVVATVVHGVDYCLFDGVVRKILHAGGFGAPGVLDNGFADEISLDVVQCIAGHARQRPLKNLLGKLVAPRPFLREPHHIYLHDRKKTVRLRVEHHQSDVERKRCFLGTADHAHLPSQFQERERARRFGEVATNLLQVVVHELGRQILHFGALVDTVIERNRGRKRQQFGFVRALGAHSTRSFADEIGVVLAVLG